MKRTLKNLTLAALMLLSWGVLRAQGSDCLVSSFPYSEDFNASTSFPTCWTSAGRAVATYGTYYARSGNCLDLSQQGFMVCLPRMDAPLNELTITFWLSRPTSWYSGQMEVGYATDSSNTNSFTAVQTVTHTSAGYAMYTVDFSTLPATAQGRIAFRKMGTPNPGLYLDDVMVTRNSPCGDAINVEVAIVGQHGAGLRWENSLGTEGNYMVAYHTVPDGWWDSLTVSTPYAFLANLLEDTTYEAQVKSLCEGQNGAYSQPVQFITQGCGKVTAGQVDANDANGRTTNYPLNGWYNYNYAQMIYPAALLSGVSDSIRALSLYSFMAYEDVVENRTVQVKMGLTSETNFANGNIAESDLTQVFSGTWSLTAGWNTITLNTPFAYDGESNIVLALNDVTGSHVVSFVGAPVFALDNLGTGAIYYSNDDNNMLLWNPNTVESVPVCRFLFQCDSTSPCEAPMVMVVSGDANSVDVAVQGPNQTEWDIYARPAGQAWWDEYGTYTSSEFSIGGLESGTQYELRIAPACGRPTAAHSTVLTILTDCGTINPPYAQDFNLYPEYSTTIPCWTLGMGGGSLLPMVLYPMGESSKMVALGASSLVALPPVDDAFEMASLNLRFQLKGVEPNEWSSSTYGVRVGVVADADSLQQAVWLDTVMASNAMPFYASVGFDSLTDESARMVVLQALPSNGWESVYIDNMWLRVTPSCPAPSNFSLLASTTTTATFAWTGESSSYLIEYLPQGGAMGTGTLVAFSDTTGTLAALSPSTRYDAYLYGVCSDTSFGIGPIAFTTGCGDITLPYSMNFDNEQAQGMPLCWSAVSGTASVFHESMGGSGYTVSAPNALTVNGIVALPRLAVDAQSAQLQFDAFAEGAYSVVVGVCDSLSASTFTAIDTLTLTAWEYSHHSLYFLHYAGTGRYIAFRTMGNEEVYLDNVVVSAAPTCLPLANLRATGCTTTDVTLAWDEQGNASQWEVSHSTTDNGTPTSGTIVASNPYTLTGLTPGEKYYVYVRSYCSASDQGEWSGPLTVAANQWVMRRNQTDTVSLCSGLIVDDGGLAGNYSGNQRSIVIVRPDTTSGNYRLRLQGEGSIFGYNDMTADRIAIYNGTDTTIFSSRLYHSDGSNNIAFDVTAHSGVATVVFYADGFREGEGFQIRVDCQPVSCPMVSDLTVSNVTENSLTLGWQPGGSEQQWIVAYGGNSLVANANVVNLTGLNPSSTYEITVRPLCSAADTGAAAVVTATTQCGLFVLASDNPLFESFETLTAPTNSCWNLVFDGNDPIHSSAEALHGTRSLRFCSEDASVASFDQYLITPMLYSEAPIELSFAYKKDNSRTEAFQVGYSPMSNDPTDTTWVWMDTITNASYNWQTYWAQMPASASYVGIHYLSTYNNGAYNLYIDSLLVSSNFSGCSAPTLMEADVTSFDAATLTWNGMGAAYELQIRLSGNNPWQSSITVEGNTYPLSGLMAGTTYQYRVRTLCPNEATSDWSMGTFSTPTLPCYAPTQVALSNISGTQLDVSWQRADEENDYEVRIWNTRIDTTFASTTTTCHCTGLYGNTDYNAAVRSRCGNGAAFSVWSDTLTFTTATCPRPTSPAATNISAHTATLTWETNGVNTFVVEYGKGNFAIGEGVRQTISSHPYTISNLESGTEYSFLVYGLCSQDWPSDYSDRVFFTTTSVGIAPVEDGTQVSLYPNPSVGEVTVDKGDMPDGTLLTVVDVQGRIVMSQTLVASHTSLTLPSGTYFVRLSHNDTNVVKRLIVK